MFRVIVVVVIVIALIVHVVVWPIYIDLLAIFITIDIDIVIGLFPVSVPHNIFPPHLTILPLIILFLSISEIWIGPDMFNGPLLLTIDFPLLIV